MTRSARTKGTGRMSAPPPGSPSTLRRTAVLASLLIPALVLLGFAARAVLQEVALLESHLLEAQERLPDRVNGLFGQRLLHFEAALRERSGNAQPDLAPLPLGPDHVWLLSDSLGLRTHTRILAGTPPPLPGPAPAAEAWEQAPDSLVLGPLEAALAGPLSAAFPRWLLRRAELLQRAGRHQEAEAALEQLLEDWFEARDADGVPFGLSGGLLRASLLAERGAAAEAVRQLSLLERRVVADTGFVPSVRRNSVARQLAASTAPLLWDRPELAAQRNQQLLPGYAWAAVRAHGDSLSVHNRWNANVFGRELLLLAKREQGRLLVVAMEPAALVATLRPSLAELSLAGELELSFADALGVEQLRIGPGEVEGPPQWHPPSRVSGLPGWSLRCNFFGLRTEQKRHYGVQLTLAGLLSVTALLLLGGTWSLFQMLAKERRLALLQREFVANISHELRTPLTSIRVLAEILEADDELAAERRVTYVQTILRESEHLSDIVDRVLDLSRLERRKLELLLEDIEPLPMLGLLADAYEARGAAASIELRRVLPEKLPEVRGNRKALEDALRNLLDNAFKYGGSAGIIFLRARTTPEAVLIEVADGGPGVPRAEESRVFERFFRSSQTADIVKGSGIGLFLCREILRNMGGDVRLVRRSAPGACFQVRLVRSHPEEQPH